MGNVLKKDGLIAVFYQMVADHKGTDMNKTTLGAPTPAPINSKCVLIVDDDSFSQTLFTEMLTSLGVTDIHTASNGRVGLRNLAGGTSCCRLSCPTGPIFTRSSSWVCVI